MKGDLHCHTTISDGSVSIGELLIMATRLGMTHLAITDHDSMNGVSRGAVVGKRLGLEVITGVEISCYDYAHDKKRIHMLCYLPENPDRMEGYFKRVCDQRKQVAEKMMKVVCDLYPITPHMVTLRASCSTNIYKTHIMHALMDAGYTGEVYGELYQKLFGDGGKAAFAPDFEDVHEVVKLIKSAGGIAVLAHPGLYGNLDALPSLIEAGIDGVELYHHRNSEEDKKTIQKICKENKLLVTGGSDFHGLYETPVKPLGSVTVGDEVLNALYHRKQKRQ